MATFFHGAPEIQTDGMQTLYLMNPSHVGYSDAGPAANQTNMVFLKSPLNSLNSMPQQPPPQQQQHFVGIPLQPSPDSNRPPPIQTATTAHDLSSIHHGHGLSPRIHYNLWTPKPSTNATSVGDVQMGARRPCIVSPAQQGLSLSLSPQQQTPFAPYRTEQDHMAAPAAAAASGGGEAEMVGQQSVLMRSKYLKAAQQLLDEVVNVRKGSRTEAAAAVVVRGNDSSLKIAAAMKGGKDLEGEVNGSGEKAADLSTAERQELQMKKTKLLNMLDEVEQRHRQYHHQMQMMVSAFEAVAGFGSARTYTALALQTISKQFRCLRDAISGLVRATSKSLGEEDCHGAGGSRSVGSRLRFVDHQLRQQRALQQLGMIQHDAWRPQRGLPGRAVSMLRAWLFEHFLCPYPKDSDKRMLAKQTGLTRSQVSNWFINARVRLWKPMVEEMYMEETKEQEQNNNGGGGGGGDDKTSKSEASEQTASNSTSQQANSSTPSRTEQNDNLNADIKAPPVPVHSSDLGVLATNRSSSDELTQQQRLKKARSDESLHHQMGMEMKPDELSNRELLMKFMDHKGAAGFGGYPIGEIRRFDHEQFAPRFGGNGVSLTLGLPHCETHSLSGSLPYLSNESMNPLGGRLELSSEENMNYFSLDNNNGNNNASASHAPNGYETISIQSRKRFAAQLLPDFVS